LTGFAGAKKPLRSLIVRRFVRPSVAPALALVLGVVTMDRAADAQTTTPTPALEETAPTPGSTTPPLDTAAAPTAFFPEAPPEAPPPLPRKKGLVLETRLGGLAFLGKFGDLAPPAPWLHGQLGREFFDWLMVFGYGELAFTGTSNETVESETTYFPIYGFGGGVRFTIHVTDRVALFVQPNAGALTTVVPRNTLTYIGFENAQNLGFCIGGRIGVEWYQIDRHMALGLAVGVRDALSFRIQDGESDVPLVLDASAALRYTF
jgi:hypothetical protein